MAIRIDIEEFPFQSKDKSVWYFTIDWSNRTQKDFYNVQGKKDLVRALKSIIDSASQEKYELLGVWNGQYSTDIFRIPIEQGFKELSKHFGE